MNKKEWLEKYQKREDKFLLSKIIDKIEETKQKNKMTITDFLDGYQKQIVEKLMKGYGYPNYFFWGGFERSERNLLIIYPKKVEGQESIIKKDRMDSIKVIRIELPRDLQGQYNHRNYLGALMKLGIERQKIGDILVDDSGADILMKPEIATYTKNELEKLTRFHKSKIEEISLEEIKKVENKVETFEIIVPSFRIDSIVSELAHTSRTKANQLILEQRVFVNYEEIQKTTKQIEIGSLITIRGMGRFYIKEKVRETKNDRIVILVEKSI